MLNHHNTPTKSFRRASQRYLNKVDLPNFKLKLRSNKSIDGRVYNASTVSEVITLIVRDINTTNYRGIILHKTIGQLQRIN